jgi:hypothetical protein
MSVNWKTLAEIDSTEKVTVIVSLTMDSPRLPRVALVGTSSGSLFVLELEFGRGIVDLNGLPSQHKHPTENIVVHLSMKAFISVDKEKTSFMWTAPNVNGEVVPAGVFAKCHACDDEAPSICPSCGRSVCGQCLAPQLDSWCPYCMAFAWKRPRPFYVDYDVLCVVAREVGRRHCLSFAEGPRRGGPASSAAATILGVGL